MSSADEFLSLWKETESFIFALFRVDDALDKLSPFGNPDCFISLIINFICEDRRDSKSNELDLYKRN